MNGIINCGGEWMPFDEDGFQGETNRVVTPERMVRLGAALGGMFEKPIGISSTGTPCGRALLAALSSGILLAGGEVWTYGDCFESQHEFCLLKSGAGAGVFLDANFHAIVRITGENGQLLPPERMRTLESRCLQPPLARYRAVGNCLSLQSLRELYGIELLKAADGTLFGVEATVKCANPQLRRILEEALTKLGCVRSEEGIVLQLSTDGKQLSAYRQVDDYLPMDRILMLVGSDLIKRGKDLLVSGRAPHLLDRIAKQYGRQVLRLEEDGEKGSDPPRERISLRDGLMLAIRLLCFLRREKLTLSAAKEQIPPLAIVTRRIHASADVLDRLGAQSIGRSVRLCRESGEVFLRSIAGKELLLTAESSKTELACALCDEVEMHIHAIGDAPPAL